jgi:hypothetical protein
VAFPTWPCHVRMCVFVCKDIMNEILHRESVGIRAITLCARKRRSQLANVCLPLRLCTNCAYITSRSHFPPVLIKKQVVKETMDKD